MTTANPCVEPLCDPKDGRYLPSSVRGAFIDLIPFMASVFPFGMTVGTAVVASRIDNVVGFLGGPLLIGGTSHLAAVTLLDAGAAALGVIVTALAINMRVAVYSAVLAPKWGTQPRWFRWLGASMLVDQTFAVVDARIDEGREDSWIRSYYLTFSVVLWIVFMVAVLAGVLVGPAIPLSWELSFASVLMFLALMVPAAKSRSSVVAVLVAVALAILLVDLPNGFGLVVAGLAGAAAGAIVQTAEETPEPTSRVLEGATR